MNAEQLDLWGKSKEEKSIERLKMFEPPEGYYLAFSGGKDSIVIKKLAELAGVKFDAHYNHTTVDPPELIYYIREHHPDVIFDMPEVTMWKLIEQKVMPPTRLVRYCCDHLKERGGIQRFVITGVRWAESSRRKNSRSIIEFDRYGSQSKDAIKRRELFLMSDNEDRRRMIETCQIKGKNIINPIVDWEDYEVWEFIKKHNIPYCELYDQGFERLGCIGCPMQGAKGMKRDFEKWPKYYQAYLRAFDRMLKARDEKGLETDGWDSAQDVMDWWIGTK